MLSLALPARRRRLTILCLGAHGDDIEIGCGAALLRLLAEYPRSRVQWVVFSGDEQRADEVRRSAGLFLRRAAARTVEVLSYRDGYFPAEHGSIKDEFERLKRHIRPDIIFTHSAADAHQDHRLLCELAWNTWRNHLILEYEVPKYDGDLGRPNVYVPVTAAVAERKVRYLLAAYRSQRRRDWFTRETFLGLMRLRGVECRSRSGLAEAFHGRKLTL